MSPVLPTISPIALVQAMRARGCDWLSPDVQSARVYVGSIINGKRPIPLRRLPDVLDALPDLHMDFAGEHARLQFIASLNFAADDAGLVANLGKVHTHTLWQMLPLVHEKFAEPSVRALIVERVLEMLQEDDDE